MTENIPTLGKLVPPDAQRDAIHIAIVPVEAASRLSPGEDVGRYVNGQFGRSLQPIGIVDPFLPGAVALHGYKTNG